MARTLRVYNYIHVIGKIWMPPGAICAYSYSPRTDDIRGDDGAITRESISDWLAKNSGDFQSIEDFEANIADGDKDILIPWEDSDSEFTYIDCTSPSED